MPAAGEEDRRVPAPGRGPLDPLPHDRVELPRPRLERAVAVARNTEML
jgi:hypothetical protein